VLCDSLSADRDVAMLSECLRTSLEENVVRTTSVKPRRVARLTDLHVDPEFFEIRVWVIDCLTMAKVAIQSIGELPKCLSLSVAKEATPESTCRAVTRPSSSWMNSTPAGGFGDTAMSKSTHRDQCKPSWVVINPRCSYCSSSCTTAMLHTR